MKTQLNSILKSFTTFASALVMFTAFGGSTAFAQTAPNDIIVDWGDGAYTIAGSRATLLAERAENGQYEQVMKLILPDGSTTVQLVRTELIAGEGSNWQAIIRLLGNPPIAKQAPVNVISLADSSWVENNSKQCTIEQSGTQLKFSNYAGTVDGRFTGTLKIEADGWSKGTVSADGHTITWENGNVWRR